MQGRCNAPRPREFIDFVALSSFMRPTNFIAKWHASALKERSAAQEHFIDLCRLLGEPTPAEADPLGESYCFERGALKDGGGDGWADVWKRHHFAWEYKGKRANLDDAFLQLRQYALALENPPLLIVSDMARVQIRTNWTNSVSKTYEFELDDLADASVRARLKCCFSDPEQLRPGETRQALTERAAASFAGLAKGLRVRGHDPQIVAQFVNRLVFCMFAEDVGLLPNRMFTRMLEHARRRPEDFAELAQELFRAMAAGGRVGFEPVPWFNGHLFQDDSALVLSTAEIDTAMGAAALDWSEIDPSILGTLFERGLDPGKRSQLGAHYTDREKIMLIVDPVVVRPWLDEWSDVQGAIAAALDRADKAGSASVRSRFRNQAERQLREFLDRLRAFRVLDPACGSGNFLYLALQSLKDLEHRVQLDAEALGIPRGFPAVGPRNVTGIEINPYAAELARVSVWIGEIQWMRRNGFSESRNPILKPLHTIECRDAVLTAGGEEAQWPNTDVVIGNPPFLGSSRIRGVLGDTNADSLYKAYRGKVPASADLVCYWFHKSLEFLLDRPDARVGLVATNSIRGGRNRTVLDRIVKRCVVFDAWSDEPWVVDGAAVRVSLVCFASKGSNLPTRLNGKPVSRVSGALTLPSLDLGRAVRIRSNRETCFRCGEKGGAFDVPGSLARQWLALPSNPNGKPNSDVLKPWVNAMDITRRPKDKWIVDFGERMSEVEAALFEAPFSYLEEHVRPVRQRNRVKTLRSNWWLHRRVVSDWRRAVKGLSRFIATPAVARHRLFAWCDSRISPDHQLIVFARDDDVTFGILHSRLHECWSLGLCTWQGIGNDPRYTPTTTFETFPFPDGLSPDVPASEYEEDPRAIAIATAAKRLVQLRERWLNPPEWVKWVDEPVPGYPKRPVPRDEAAPKALNGRTLTKLYNARPRWLSDAHDRLDSAVAAAYGWPPDMSREAVLACLLKLNLAAA